jgi:hypothetical protein
MTIQVSLEESQRQMILLAIAELALRRPGWDWTLGELSDVLQGRAMFETFKQTSADAIKPLSSGSAPAVDPSA